MERVMRSSSARPLTVALLAFAVCFMSGSATAAVEARLLWQDTVDVSTFDQAFDVAASANGVFVPGFLGNQQGHRELGG